MSAPGKTRRHAIKGTLLEDQYTFSIISQFFLESKMFQTKVVKKLETYILCSMAFISENRAVYEITWEKIL